MSRLGRALVTGAAAGLGLAICRQLAAAGWQVVALDRSRDGLARLEGECGDTVTSHVCDLADAASVDGLEAVFAADAPFRLVVHSAGINRTGQFSAIPADEQRAIIAVNLTAPMAITALMTRSGAVERGGCLVFISSLSRYVGYPGASAYAASKEGLAVFARSLRRPLSRSGIKVLTVCPGPLDTAHATEHAPPGAEPGNRLDPNVAASAILAAVRRPRLTGLYLGGNVCVPGLVPKLIAFTGMVFPALATRAMRRMLFEKF